MATREPNTEPTRRRILLVACDDSTTRAVLRSLDALRSPTSLETAHRTAQAFQLLQREHFDICITPARQLRGLLNQVRALGSWPSVLAWSESNGLDLHQNALSAGADGVLHSEADADEIARQLETALRHQSRILDVHAKHADGTQTATARWRWNAEGDVLHIDPAPSTEHGATLRAAIREQIYARLSSDETYFEYPRRHTTSAPPNADSPLHVRGYVQRGPEGKASSSAGTATYHVASDTSGARLPHDRVTGVYNRDHFQLELESAWRTRQDTQRSYAVLSVDLDGFRRVNEEMGHSVGDTLLNLVANRIRACVRPQDVVARLASDEFGVLFPVDNGLAEITAIAESILFAVGRPVEIEDTPIWLQASAGLAQATDGPVDGVLRDAMTALQRAKADASQHLVVFAADMRPNKFAVVRLDAELHRAVEEQEFVLFYQPLIRMDTGHVTGFEALIRWQHPERGLVSPGIFIDRVEENGLILPVGRWVLHEACRQIREWRSHVPGAQHLTVSVNLSPRQFHAANALRDVSEALSAHALDPAAVRLEITENTAMTNAESSIRQLQAFSDLGIQLQIDDFGTGYSSLNYLTRLPVDILKIDRSFVMELESDPRNRVVVNAIMQLADGVGLRTVAEGIETPSQLAYLSELGSHFGQGYLFAPPRPPEEAIKLVGRDLRPVADSAQS